MRRALGAADAVLAVDDEERHALDAVGASLSLVLANGRKELFALERRTCSIGVEADLDREVDEVVDAPDVLALGEVGGHEPLLISC